MASAAAPPVPLRAVTLSDLQHEGRTYDMQLNVVNLVDRRPSQVSNPQEWLFQKQVEDVLFPESFQLKTNGAFYRLLKRSAAPDNATLCLRHASVGEGLVSNEEFEALKGCLHTSVRVFTLVPMNALAMAVEMYGPTDASVKLLAAMGLAHPASWPSAAEEDEGEEDEEEEDDDDDDDDDEHGDGSGGGGGSDGSRSRSHHDSERDSEEEEEEEEEGEEEEEEEEDDDEDEDGEAEGEGGGSSSAGSSRRLPPITVSNTLEAQLTAFATHRSTTVCRQRKGKAVGAVTAKDDRRSILHFLAWLKHAKGVESPTLNLFMSPKISAAVEAFVKEKRATCAHARLVKVVGSLLAAARFVFEMIKAKADGDTAVSTAPIEELQRVHAQCNAEARAEAKFNAATPPKAFLTWDECQRARLRAERAAVAYKGDDAAEKLSLVRSRALLKLLTGMPPDRVRVYRELKLGSSLMAVGGGVYKIDLGREAHKTSSVFGPSRCTLPMSIAEPIDALVSIQGLAAGDYLFHAKERGDALSPTAWCRLVQATFKTYSGIPLSPKDCRASFVTWMRGGEHGDEVLKSAANAMHHSSTVAASAAYDKDGSDRIVGSAMEAAEAFAKRFV